MKVASIILARGGSKGVPNKNKRDFFVVNHLFHGQLNNVLKVGLIRMIFLSVLTP